MNCFFFFPLRKRLEKRTYVESIKKNPNNKCSVRFYFILFMETTVLNSNWFQIILTIKIIIQ